MIPNRLGLLALTLCLGISGCSSVVNATVNADRDDRGTRTFGSKIDDSLIETKVEVNIAKAATDLDKASRIVVTSFNGVVLLAGQTPRPTSRPRPNKPPRPCSGSRRSTTNCK
jgi:osmotically-inducible protein OsmY